MIRAVSTLLLLWWNFLTLRLAENETCANINVAHLALWSGKISKGLIIHGSRTGISLHHAFISGWFHSGFFLSLKKSFHQICFQPNPWCFMLWTSFSSSKMIDGNVQVQSNFVKKSKDPGDRQTIKKQRKS